MIAALLLAAAAARSAAYVYVPQIITLPAGDVDPRCALTPGTTAADPMPGYKRAMGFAHVTDKFERAGLTAVAPEAVAPPRVAECLIQIECEVLSVREVGPSGVDHAAAVEVRAVRTHVHEAILKTGHRHHIDPDRWRPLMMSFLEFYGLGPRVRPSHLAEIF